MFVTVQDALLQARETLRASAVDAPGLTARVLLADALNCSQTWLVAHDDRAIEQRAIEAFSLMIRSRCDGVPMQYIRGVQEFYELELRVTPEVLIPRPETEHLVEAALERLGERDRVLDVGTGSGAIAIALARHAPRAGVVASDKSGGAIAVARGNAARLGEDVACIQANLVSAFRSNSFDMVVSNPPYVATRDAAGLQRELQQEPPMALFAGSDGLQVIRELALEVPRVLKPDGWLLFEIGAGFRQGVEALLARPAWKQPSFVRDLSGKDRVVVVQRSPVPA